MEKTKSFVWLKQQIQTKNKKLGVNKYKTKHIYFSKINKKNHDQAIPYHVLTILLFVLVIYIESYFSLNYSVVVYQAVLDI